VRHAHNEQERTVRKTLFFFLVLMGIVPVGCVVDSGPEGGYGGGYNGPNPGGDECNPVTAAGCSSEGSSCDLAPSGYFACFPPPNTADICGSCDSNVGPFCAAELTCVALGAGPGACYRYCCTNADCGPGGICDTGLAAQYLDPSDPGDQVGLCVTSLASQAPACGAPAAPPNGSCFGGYTGGPGDAGPMTMGPAPDGGTGPAEGGGSEGGGADGGGFGEGGRGGRGGDGG
jgi:hypothetical protein